MNSNLNKTERFLKAINSDADARCDKIKQDVDEYIENEIKKLAVLPARMYVLSEAVSLTVLTKKSMPSCPKPRQRKSRSLLLAAVK